MTQLTELERDQLKEVVNIGVGNASTALSQMLRKQVTITTPDAFIDNIEGIPTFLGGTDVVTTAILSDLTNDISGTMFLMLPPDSAQKLAALLTGDNEIDIIKEDGMGQSALKEVGNILTGSSMTALSRFLDLNVIASVPHIATDMLGSLIDGVIARMVEESNTVLVFRVHFTVKDEAIGGDLYLLFDPEVTKKILSAMHSKFSN